MTETKRHNPTADNIARAPWIVRKRDRHERGAASMPWMATDCDGCVVAYFASSMAASAAVRGVNAEQGEVIMARVEGLTS